MAAPVKPRPVKPLLTPNDDPAHTVRKGLPHQHLPHGQGSAGFAGAGWTAIAGLPLKMRPHAGRARNEVGNDSTVTSAATAASVAVTPLPSADGVMVQPDLAAPIAGTIAADVQLDYSSFEDAHGGAWGSRLKVWQLPACFATTPTDPACAAATPVESANDSGTGTLEFTVSSTAVAAPTAGQSAQDATIAPADPTASSTPTTPASGAVRPAAFVKTAASTSSPSVYVVAAGTSGDAGNFAANPTPPSSQWQVGDGSGAFSYSYPIGLPPAAVAGGVPSVSLDYDSQSVDGRNVSKNAQVSMLGEGWQLGAGGYITRSYASCADDDPTDFAGKGDKCWATRKVDAGGGNTRQQVVQDLTLVMGGRSTRLVQIDNTSNYRLQDDPSWIVTRVVNGTGDDAASNTAHDNEAFKIRTPDGTTYWFGWGHGSKSTLTMPVFADDSTQPCYQSTPSASWCQQGYQWGLDRVIDRHSNETNYQYDKDTNYYALFGNTGAPVVYDRDGYLTKITYGAGPGTGSGDPGSSSYDQVDFNVQNRCLGTINGTGGCGPVTNASDAQNWPEVPTDQICDGSGTCLNGGPALFSTVAYASITTSRHGPGTPAGGLPVDTYNLSEQLESYSDSNVYDLWLHSVTRIGQATSTAGAGTPVGLPAVEFDGIYLQNRVDPENGHAFFKRRITTVINETGGRVDVSYDDPAQTTDDNASGAKPAGLDPSNTGARLCNTTSGSGTDVTGKSEDASPGDCYPSHFTVGSGAYDPDQTSWWNKYMVVRVALNDAALGSALATPGIPNLAAPTLDRPQVFDYSYGVANGAGAATGQGSKPAWRYRRSPQTPDAEQTWDDWRGYQTVAVHTRKLNDDHTLIASSGHGPTAQLVDLTQSVESVFRGMYDTRSNKAGDLWITGPVAYLTTPLGAMEEDNGWRNGRLAESDIEDPSGAVMSRSYSHYASFQTADAPKTVDTGGTGAAAGDWWAPAKYVYTDKTQSQARAGAAIGTVTTTVDGGGADHRGYLLGAILSTTDDHGTPSSTSDDVATCTTWAPNSTEPSLSALLLAQEVTQKAVDCGSGSTVLTDSKMSYDGHAFGAHPGLGDLTLASAQADSSTSVNTGTSYDSFGRVTGTTQPYYDGATQAWSTTLYNPGGDATALLTHTSTTGPAASTGLPAGLGSHVASTGFAATSNLDPARGVTTSQTDANGNTTSLGYDALGRITTVTEPGNSSGTPNRAYSYRVVNAVPTGAGGTDLAPDPSRIVTTTLRSTDGGPVTDVSATYLDGWGRAVETLLRNQNNNQWLASATGYGNQGQPWLNVPTFGIAGAAGVSGLAYATPQILPSSGTVNHYTVTAIDALGRPTQVADESNGTINRATVSSYLPAADSSGTLPVSASSPMVDTSALVPATGGVLADPATGSVSKTVTNLDALGRTASVDQYGNGHSADTSGNGAGNTGGTADDGYASYTYTALGQLATITEPLPAQGTGSTATNATWSYSYDRLGRKTTSVDPDTGTTTFGYDALGDTTMSDDALPNNAGTGSGTAGTAGGQIQTTYDALGRPVLRERVTDPGTGSEARTSMGDWTYDTGGTAANALGQLTATTSHTPMGDFTTTRTYDARGNVTGQTRTYPKALLDITGGGSLSLTYGYTYNQLDEVTTTSYPAAGGNAGDGTGARSLPALTTTDTYGANGTFNALADSLGHTLGQAAFDDLDRTTNLNSGTPTGGAVINDANGLFRGYTYGNAGADADRLTASAIATGSGAATSLAADSYAYDTAGNPLRDARTVSGPDITGGSGSVSAAWCYGYDGINRLTSVMTSTAASSGKGCDPVFLGMTDNSAQTIVAGAFQDLTYSYSGGRLATVHSEKPQWLNTATQNATYAYASSVHPHAATQISADGQDSGSLSLQNGLPTPGALAYDTAGRISSWNPVPLVSQWVRGQTNYTYDPTGNPTFSDDVSGNTPEDMSAAYDLSGNRVARDQNVASQNLHATVLYLGGSAGAETEITVNHAWSIYPTSVVARRVFTTPDGKPLATQDGINVTTTGDPGTWTWQAGDAHHSVALDKAASTATISRQTYYPFGDMTTGSGQAIGERSYLDKPYDPTREIRLDARTYSPTLDVLTAPDPLLTPTNPQHLSPYSYSANNPLAGADPSGLQYKDTGAPQCTTIGCNPANHPSWVAPEQNSSQYTQQNNPLPWQDGWQSSPLAHLPAVSHTTSGNYGSSITDIYIEGAVNTVSLVAGKDNVLGCAAHSGWACARMFGALVTFGLTAEDGGEFEGPVEPPSIGTTGAVLGDASGMSGWLPKSIPRNAQDSIDNIARYGVDGTQGASGTTGFAGPSVPGVFENSGRNGGYLLPRKTAAGEPITYREWGVWQSTSNPKPGGERIVTGSDGSIYYTPTHYQSYIVAVPGE